MKRAYKRNQADAKPTWTALVLDALIKADDFMSLEQIMDAVKAPDRRLIRVTILWLRRFNAVDSVVVEDKPWWFATPENDTRTKHLDLRIPEENKRAPRKPRNTITRKV